MPIGVLGTWDYSPGPTARRTFTCTKSLDSGRDSCTIMSKSIRQRLLEGWMSPARNGRGFPHCRKAIKQVIEDCRELTNTIYDGLDLAGEIRAIDTQDLGDTVLWDDARLVGFAACHVGAGTEAGSGACYIKFGAIRPGDNAGENFERLLDACEALAATLGAQLLTAGANGPPRGVSCHAPVGIPHRHPRRRDAAIGRSGLPRSRRLYHRRLALTRLRRTDKRKSRGISASALFVPIELPRRSLLPESLPGLITGWRGWMCSGATLALSHAVSTSFCWVANQLGGMSILHELFQVPDDPLRSVPVNRVAGLG